MNGKMNYAPLDHFIAENTTPIYAGAGDFDYIKEQYEKSHGAKGWTAALVQNMFGTSVRDKNAFEKNSPEWKEAKKNYDTDLRLIQRYGKGTINPERASASIREKLSEIGQKLDPVRRDVPASGLTLTIDFRDTSTKKRQQDRSTPALQMDYQTALQYVNLPRPDYAFLFDLWGDKKIGTNIFGEDGPYPADILDVY